MTSSFDNKDNFQQQNMNFQQEFANVERKFTILQQEYVIVVNQLSIALKSIADQSLEIQTLKDEIARLKGTSPRPKLPKGNLEGPGSGNKGTKGTVNPGRGNHPRKNKRGLDFQNIERLKPDNIPEGAIFKGTRKYDVQDIIYQAYNTRYIIERWLLPDGTYIEGKLPAHIQGHYGSTLRAHIIMLSYSCRVPQDLLLEQLHRCKIAISDGQLQSMLTENHNDFHDEKEEILEAALACGRIQTDDVGTRHQAKNCYTNVICNEFFVYLKTTDSKSRINFLEILAQGRNEYRFNQDAYDYLTIHNGTEKLIQALKIRKDFVINTKNPEKAFINEMGHLNAIELRLMTEAGLFASLIEHGVPRYLNVHSDDAGQFEVFKQSLCWIHEERHYRKLIPAHPEMALEIEKIRSGIWQLYNGLKTYKEAPSESESLRLSQMFEDLFNPKIASPYQLLNDRLALTYAKKDRLLFVLKHPSTPLHNNLSETGGRGAKVKSKISGGTRSENGRRAWDTFGSLNLTCRRLGLCFYDYLMDRLLGAQKITRLGTIIKDRMQSVDALSPVSDLAISLNTS